MVTYRKISNAFHRTLGDIPSFEIQDGPNFTNFIEHTLSVRFIHHVFAINLVVLSFLLEHSRHPLSLESPPGGEAGASSSCDSNFACKVAPCASTRWEAASNKNGWKSGWLTRENPDGLPKVFHGCFRVFLCFFFKFPFYSL